MKCWELFGLYRSTELRQEVRALLSSPEVQEELAGLTRAADGSQIHARRAYAALGSAGLLAPHWPKEFGGRGGTTSDAAEVAEEMALAGVPDSAHVNTTLNIGETLLKFGNKQQKAAYLPAIASGTLVGCVLYSEPGVGSDLGALTTEAVPTDTGWELTGRKIWAVHVPDADLGVCAARVPGSGNRYEGLSTFLVPLAGPGIEVELLDAANPEALYAVDFQAARLPNEALIGTLGSGWHVINRALSSERNGMLYSGRARRWLCVLNEALLHTPTPSPRRSALLDAIGQLDAELRAARLAAWRCVQTGEEGGDTYVDAAATKWWLSEVAARVADLCWHVRRFAPEAPLGPSIEAICEEALALRPALTLAAGSSEMMLSIVLEDLCGSETAAEVPG